MLFCDGDYKPLVYLKRINILTQIKHRLNWKKYPVLVLFSDVSQLSWFFTLKPKKTWIQIGRKLLCLKENWRKTQGLKSNIFTVSQTILCLLINKILTDQSHAVAASGPTNQWLSVQFWLGGMYYKNWKPP